MSFLRNAGSLAATSAVLVPIGLITSVVLARFLGPTDMGFYSILQRFGTVAYVFCLLGSQSASIYRLRNARISPAIVAAAALVIVGCASALVTLLLVANGAWLTTVVLGGVPMLAFVISLVAIPTQTIGRMMMSFARGLDRFGWSNAYLVSVAAGSCLALTIGFAGFDANLFGALAIVAGVHVLAAVGITARVVAFAGLRFEHIRREIGELTRYGIKSHAQVILTQLHENVDVLILAALLDDPAQVAYYAIATGVVNRIKILPASIANALLPHAAGQEPAQAARFTARAARHTFAWVWIVALSAALAAPLVVPWAYGEAFRAVVRPILILLPATIFLATNSLIARYFMAINRQSVVVSTQTVSTSLNVALNFALIPTWGITGAAIASLTSYGTELLLITTAFRYNSGVPLRRVFLLDREDLAEYARRWRQLRDR